MKVKTPAISQEALRQKIKDHYKDKRSQETGDLSGGIKIFINDHTFIWFRTSKTEENVLRIIADSKEDLETEKALKEAKELIENIV